MAKNIHVTFGQLPGLLSEVGFTTDEVREMPRPRAPVRICRDPANQKYLFLPRERPLNETVREFELLTTRMHLDYGGSFHRRSSTGSVPNRRHNARREA